MTPSTHPTPAFPLLDPDLDLDDPDPTEPIAFVRCPGCRTMTAVSLLGPERQPCETCGHAVEVGEELR